MSTQEPTGAPPVVADAVLESLYQHRLLSSGQIHRMHMPDTSVRWTRRVLTGLRRSGLVSLLRTADGEGGVYFLTSKGAKAVESIASRTPTRGKPITPEQAAGPLRAHTLAVNETGIAFMQAARERGDDFGPLAWQHEIAHPVGARRGNLLIADSLLSYLRYGEDDELIFESRLLELDRGTLPTDALAAKLSRYARLYEYTLAGQSTPAWRSRYPVFPGVLCVLAGQNETTLKRRIEVVLALCREDSQLSSTPEVEISLGLLSDLRQQGPFASIWQRPGQEPRLEWLGRDADSSRPG